MKIASLLLTATSLILTSLPMFGTPLSIVNTTTGASVFNRPTEAPFDLSLIGTAVPYYALPFAVSLNGDYDFSAVATVPADNFDTFVHLYFGQFNPLAPLDNLLAANDDAGAGSALNGQSLLASQTYVFVIDGFDNDDFGGFAASISGPGDVSRVPDQSPTILLTGMGLAGLGLVRRWASVTPSSR